MSEPASSAPRPPVKLYVNPAHVDPTLSHTFLLYPFWGAQAKKTEHYATTRTKHTASADDFALVSTPAEADYILMAHPYPRLLRFRPDLIAPIIAEAEAHGKPLLIDDAGDHASDISYKNCVIIRIDTYRATHTSQEIIMPVPCEDLLETYCGGVLQPRPKKDIPSVGFVGWGALSLKQRTRSFIKEIPTRLMSLFIPRYRVYEKGVFWRERAVRALIGHPRIETKFIIRSSYSGHISTAKGDAKQSRQEFVDNLLDADYALIVRGDANAATRFYEALSLGRIPLFLDTECVLPLEHHINYRDFCLFVDYADLPNIADVLADFHASITSAQFLAMQQQARNAFETYLRPDAFSRKLANLLRARLE